MEEYQLKEGDRFMLHTKYGGIVYGIVHEIRYRKVYDQGLVLIEPSIVSTNGVLYRVNNGKYSPRKILREMNEEEQHLTEVIVAGVKNKQL